MAISILQKKVRLRGGRQRLKAKMLSFVAFLFIMLFSVLARGHLADLVFCIPHQMTSQNVIRPAAAKAIGAHVHKLNHVKSIASQDDASHDETLADCDDTWVCLDLDHLGLATHPKFIASAQLRMDKTFDIWFVNAFQAWMAIFKTEDRIRPAKISLLFSSHFILVFTLHHSIPSTVLRT